MQAGRLRNHDLNSSGAAEVLIDAVSESSFTQRNGYEVRMEVQIAWLSEV